MIRVGIIMPAYQAEHLLPRSLPPLLEIAGSHPVLVVDPGSADRTANVARELGAEVLELGRRAGPAEARNEGVARLADVDVVLFIDCDCVVHADVLERVIAAFEGDEGLVSLTGSYDDTPPERNFASLYMNLRHHFVHQGARTEGASFWAGCGAVRRTAFESVSGFDVAQFPRPMIEDIELGQRLAPLGSMRLDPALHVTHLKRWNLGSVIHTDIFCRAFPWSRLILATGKLPNDLNVSSRERVAAMFAGLALFSIALGFILLCFSPAISLFCFGLGIVLPLSLGRPLLRFFAQRAGIPFAIGAFAFHQVHLTYSAVVFAYCKFESLFKSRS